MAHDNQERLIALAGIYQAVACVTRIARRGSADTAAMEPCIYSLLQVDADDVASVYGVPGAVSDGARQVIAQLTGKPERDLELTRYVINILKLERTLSRRPDMLTRIAKGIEQAREKLDYFAVLHPNMLAHFADIYADTISHLQPRILVRGESLHLQNPDNQGRIRALLLAAIRSAMLWRQVGGSKLALVLGHRRMLQEAHRYLELASEAENRGSIH